MDLQATPYRADKRELGDTFQKTTFNRDIKTMIDEGWLSPVYGRKCLTTTSLKGVYSTCGDFDVGTLATAVNIPERNKFIVNKYKTHANRRKTIAFCVNVQHCHDLAAEFNKQGICCRAVWGAMDPEERRKTLKDFKNNKILVLTSCGILTEGYDEETVSCIVMARPTKSRGLYVQSVGRGIRRSEGKTDCLVLDFSDRYHNLNSLMDLKTTIPSAVEIVDERFLKKEGGSTLIAGMNNLKQQVQLSTKELCDKQFDILGHNNNIEKQFEWVSIGDDEWSFSDDNNNEIVIRPLSDGFVADVYNFDGLAAHLIIDPVDRKQCKSICQKFIEDHMTTVYTQKNGSWMIWANTQKATQAQVDILYRAGLHYNVTKAYAAVEIRRLKALERKKNRNYNPNEVTEKQAYFLRKHGFETNNVTKFEAMALISKIKQGAPVNTQSI